MVTRGRGNERMLAEVARRLGPLVDAVVFLGGATVSLLLTDTGAPEVRGTLDVDAVVDVVGRVEFHRFEERLVTLGFRRDTEEGAPVCRWLIEGIRVDLMPTASDVLGFSNRWYPLAMSSAGKIRLSGGIEIRVVAPACFLATKLEAFKGRGQGDFAASHDIEDVIALVDGRAEIVEEVRSGPPDLFSYLREEIRSLLASAEFLESLSGHLLPDAASQGRLGVVLERLRRISLIVSPLLSG